jgi:hypothetical protein
MLSAENNPDLLAFHCAMRAVPSPWGEGQGEGKRRERVSQDLFRSVGDSDFSLPSTFVIRISSLPLVSIIADCFHRAAFLGLFALRLFLRRTRLFINEGITSIIIAFEIVRSGFATQVAVDALVIDVKFAGDAFRIFVCDVSHNSPR